MKTTRQAAARAILADFRQWYQKKYGKKETKRIVSKRQQVTAK